MPNVDMLTKEEHAQMHGAGSAGAVQDGRALWYYGGPTSVSDPNWHGSGLHTVISNTSPSIYASAASLLNES